MSDATASAPIPPDDAGWEWAVVEVMGHRRHAGRTREEQRFGTTLLRIDIPVDGEPEVKGWRTIWYRGEVLFSFSLCARDAALLANRPYRSPARLSHADERDDDAADADHADLPF